ncbi:MAG: RecQ family ATP-dependent DNA helicase, partial [Acidobacteriota bacterium]
MKTASSLDAALARFGHARFREGQREAIETLLTTGRVLLVAPTGGGKSLTYQVPASLLPGTALVISPLIALMQDQVVALERCGVPATFIASTLPAEERRRRVDAMARGAFKLVYVAPERLSNPNFLARLSTLECSLLAVDEAHCISAWGHDFRPDYLQIGKLVDLLPDARVLACTATATPVVRDEIIERLGLPADTPQILRGFARPNLALRAIEVTGARDRRGAVDAALAKALSEPHGGRGTAIIYSPTRKAAEAEAKRLEGTGWRCRAYHAGMDGAMRNAVQQAFMTGELDVVVATNAFGMGIDRADVRAVIHLGPPGSLEAYYQEVGRAGRDGQRALGLLLYASTDLPLRRFLIEHAADGTTPDAATVAHRWNLFLELVRWADGGSCRHDAILRYFGDDEETLSGCGICDVCVELNAHGEEQPDPEDVTLVVRKALCGVARTHGRFGLGAAINLLRGVSDERLDWAGLSRSKTFGILADRSEDWLKRLLRRLVTAGWVDFTGERRPVAVVTAAGGEVIEGRRPVRLVLPPLRAPRPARIEPRASGRSRRAPASRTGAPRPAALPADALRAEDRALLEALRAHRLAVARAQGVPPYVVAHDRTLRDVAATRPTTHAELLLAHGMGP